MIGTRTFQKMIGNEGGATGVDDDFAVRGLANVGAWILGRNMFGPVRGAWPDETWKGWWGANPRYHTPVFVLTHYGRPSIAMEGGTTFHFVTGGILEALKRATDAAGGQDVRHDWHEGQLKEQRLPYRKDLDRATSNHPVVVVRGGHEYILNSAALEKWKITAATPEPEGGSIGRYPDGSLNGELVDRAKVLVALPPSPLRDPEQSVGDQIAEFKRLNEAGLTTIRFPGTSIETWRTLQEMRRRGVLTMRVNVLFSRRRKYRSRCGDSTGPARSQA